MPQVNPAQVMHDLGEDTAYLDDLTKALALAETTLNQAEAEWDEVYDAIAEDLKDEMAGEGRKGDPAEHYITSVARRQHRDIYVTYRRSKRAVEMLERRLQAKKTATSGRQSLLNALQAELRNSFTPRSHA